MSLHLLPDWALMALFLVIVLMLAWMVKGFVGSIKQGLRKNLGEQMIKKAKNYRRRFVLNIDHDITAICTLAVFTKGLYAHNQKVESGEMKEWEKVVVYAKPSFTFAGSEQTRRPVHTGTRTDLELIAGSIIMVLTGVDPDTVSRKDYEKALQIIFERDSRLFVPYAGSPSDGEKQFAFYGKTTIEQAIADINRAVGL